MKPFVKFVLLALVATCWVVMGFAQEQIMLKTQKGVEIEATDWALTDSGIWLRQQISEQELRTQFVYIAEIHTLHLYRRKQAKPVLMGLGVITLSWGAFLQDLETPDNVLSWEYRTLAYYPRAKASQKQFYIGGDAALYALQFREMLTQWFLTHQQHDFDGPLSPGLDF